MMLNWILSVDFARMLNCEKTATLNVIEASNLSSIKTVGVMGFISGLIALLYQDKLQPCSGVSDNNHSCQDPLCAWPRDE